MKQGKSDNLKKPKGSKAMADDVFYHCGYTRYPPDGEHSIEDLCNLTGHVSEEDLDTDTSIMLRLCHESFKESGNPYNLLMAFVVAHKAGLYPPMWVQCRMAEVLNEYFESQGTKKLEKLFGFTRGRGQDSAFKELANEQRNSMIHFDVYRLTVLFDISIDVACHMVARRLKETPYDEFNGTKLGLRKDLSEDTIKDQYMKKFGKKFRKFEYSKELLLNWPDEERASYLRTFPEDSIPLHLASLLS